MTILDGSTRYFSGIAVRSPLDLGSTLKLWCRAESLALSDGATCASFTDLSGNANHILQATEANKPIYKVNRVNGYAALAFVDSTDNMKTAAGLIAMNAAKSLFVVYRNYEVSGSNIRAVVGEGDTGAAANFFYIMDRGDVVGKSPYVEFYGTGLASGISLADGCWKIASASYAGGSSGITRFFYGSNLTDTGVLTGTGTSDGLRLAYAPAYVFAGEIAEIIYCDTQLSISDHLKVVRYLQRQYGIYN